MFHFCFSLKNSVDNFNVAKILPKWRNYLIKFYKNFQKSFQGEVFLAVEIFYLEK